MRYLLLFLAIPFLSAEAAAPDCSKLKQIANELEKTIQSKRFGAEACDKITPESLNLPAGSIGFSGDYDYRCKDLSAIDMQLRSLENEIALLKGIDTLKSEINSSLVTLKKYENKDAIKAASSSFMKNLTVARSIERFLLTSNANENILSKVAADKAGWTDKDSFTGLLSKYCGAFPSKGTVCENGYSLSEDTFKEINDFIKIGKGTERKFNPKQVEDLRKALAIKKGDKEYSYELFAAELKGVQENGLLASEDVAIIKDMPPISNDKSYDFIKNMKSSAELIKSSSDLVHAQATPSRFKSLLNDLKKRQEWEMKSKFSLVLNQYDQYLPSEVADVCNNARELNGSIEDCLTPLSKSKELKSFQQGAVGDLIAEFKYGKDHLTKLDELIKECIPDDKLIYPTKCEGMISQQMADLVAKSQALNALKAKHIQASPDLFTFRNFALEKLHAGECMTAGESKIQECSVDIGNISREAITLSGDAKDILYVFEKPAENTVVEQLCLSSEEKVPFKKALCALKDEDPEKKSNKTYGDDFEAPVSPDSGNSTGKALIDLGSSILNSVAGYMAPPQQPMVNPYNSIFPYETYSAQPRDIKNQIMDPYVSHGFGNYYPTQGVKPYSSINSNAGVAGTYSFGGGSIFNAPPGG